MIHTYQEVESFVKKYVEANDFTGGASSEEINQVEKQLDVKLPEQYKWFLEKYGYGGVLGILILGIGKTSNFPVVKYTNRLRDNFNLPKEYVVIESCDEFFYCLSTINGNVVYWDRVGLGRLVAENFLDFLYEKISDASENY